MIEQYVLDELKKYKEENDLLKEQLINEKSRSVRGIDEQVVRVELIPTENCVKKLKEANIDLNYLVDEMGSRDIANTIITLNLYKDKIKTKRSDDTGLIVKVNNKYYELTKYYNDYKLENEVFITLEDAVCYDLVDELYDNINNYLRQEKEVKPGE